MVFETVRFDGTGFEVSMSEELGPRELRLEVLVLWRARLEGDRRTAARTHRMFEGEWIVGDCWFGR